MRQYEVILPTGTAFADVAVVQAYDEENALEVAAVQGYGVWVDLDDGIDDFGNVHDLIDNQDEYLYLDLTVYDKGIGLLYIVGASVKELDENG